MLWWIMLIISSDVYLLFLIFFGEMFVQSFTIFKNLKRALQTTFYRYHLTLNTEPLWGKTTWSRSHNRQVAGSWFVPIYLLFCFLSITCIKDPNMIPAHLHGWLLFLLLPLGYSLCTDQRLYFIFFFRIGFIYLSG